MDTELILTGTGIKKGYPVPGGDLFWALKGVDIEVPRSRLTILKGRSGSGKTTLMNILSGLDQATEGTVVFDGKPMDSMSEAARTSLRRKDIGFVFQSVALIPIMTAAENVDYALRLAGWKGDRKERVTECLELVGLGKRMAHLPSEMSGGEQQRVAIARALANNPKVLFADEPSGNLDSKTKGELHRLFFDLRDRFGITIVIVTHDKELAAMSDRTVEIRDGQII